MADSKSKAPATPIDDDPFSSPGGGSFVDMSDILGDLVVIEVIEFVPEINTVNGNNAAIRADLHVLTGNLEGESYEETLLWGRVLIPQLKRRIGEIVLARIAQGEKKKGQNAPWRLEANISPEDKARAMEWYRNRQPANPFSKADQADA